MKKSFEKQSIESDDEYLEGYDCSGSTGIYKSSFSMEDNSASISFYHKKTQDVERTLLECKRPEIGEYYCGC